MRFSFGLILLLAAYVTVLHAEDGTPRWYYFKVEPSARWQGQGEFGRVMSVPGLPHGALRLGMSGNFTFNVSSPNFPGPDGVAFFGVKDVFVTTSMTTQQHGTYNYGRFLRSSDVLPLPPVNPQTPEVQFEKEEPVVYEEFTVNATQVLAYESASQMSHVGPSWFSGGGTEATWAFEGWVKIIHPNPPPGPDIEFVRIDGETAVFRFRNAVAVDGQPRPFLTDWTYHIVPLVNGYASATAYGVRQGETSFAEVSFDAPVRVKVILFPGIVSAQVKHKSQYWTITQDTEILVNDFVRAELRAGVRYELQDTVEGLTMILYPDVVPGTPDLFPADPELASEQEALSYLGDSNGVSVYGGSSGIMGIDRMGNLYRQETANGPLVMQKRADGQDATQGGEGQQPVEAGELDGTLDLSAASNAARGALSGLQAPDAGRLIGTASNPVVRISFPYPRNFSECASGVWQGSFSVLLAGQGSGGPGVDLRDFVHILKEILGAALTVATMVAIWKGGV